MYKSTALNASGMPVRPPMPNIGRKADANSIGVLNRIDPPHSDKSKAVSRMTDGIEMRMVVVWKNALTFGPMPVIYMWCAHTMKERKASTKMAPTMALYPQIGFRVLQAMTSV